MSKKNKVIYSDIQPNAKEAGVWVNTNDGNIKIEKDGEWVDDGGSSNGGSGENIYYYNVYNINPLVHYSNKVKVKFEGDATWITSSCKWMYEYPESSSERYVVSAIAVQYPIEDYLTGDTALILNNLEEVVSFFDLNISDFTPITKEEFYSSEFFYPES